MVKRHEGGRVADRTLREGAEGSEGVMINMFRYSGKM